MLRRNVLRLGGGGGKSAAAFSAGAPGPAEGLGDKPLFRVSSFFRDVDHPAVSSQQLAAEGIRTGRDAASASFIDYVELQWYLIPYRFRKLGLEIQEVRRIGWSASLPECKLELFGTICGLIVVFWFTYCVGRGSMFKLTYPRKEEQQKESKQEEEKKSE